MYTNSESMPIVLVKWWERLNWSKTSYHVFGQHMERTCILKKIPDVSFSETNRLSHLSSYLLNQGGTKSPVWTHFQMYGIAFFSLPVTFLENGREKFWKKFQLFLLVKPVIWAIIRRNPLLGTLRYCTTSKVLKSHFFHFKPRCWRRIWTKNSVKNSRCFSW